MTVETDPTLWGSYSVVSASGDLDTVSTLPDGGYVLAWRENGLIRFQLYNGNGDKVGGAHTLDAPIVGSTSQWQPDILTKPDGSFVITWTEGTGAASGGRVLRSQTFDMHGAKLGDAVTLDSLARADGVHTIVDSSGNLMTAYVKTVVDGPNSSLRLSFAETTATGTVTTSTDIEAAGEVNIDWLGNDRGYAVSYMHDNDLFISVIRNGIATTFTTDIKNINESDLVALKGANGDPNGRFAITYVDSSTHKVTVDTFHIENNVIVRDTTVALGPQTTDSTGLKTSIAALRDGGYAVAYKGQADGFAEIFVKVFDASGNEGPAIRIPVSGHQDTPSISEMADGRLAVTWHDRGTGQGPIETIIVDARATAVTVVGTAENDVYAPSKHTGDNLDGGNGIDTLTFKESGAGVTVSLANENGTSGDATDDIYKNFENIIGSKFSDILVGNSGANILEGGHGNDILNGDEGADRMIGGAGNDTYTVDNAGDRVVETSTGGTMDIVSTSVSYALSSYVERLYASGSASISLTGNTLSNVIKGNTGTNKIYSGAGNDTLYGGSGKDYFVFNATPSSWTNKDSIRDWSSRDDTIYLDNAVFRKFTKTGMVSSSVFKVASKALDANDYLGYNKMTGDLWYDSNGSAAGGQVSFANIGANKIIKYTDFIII